MKLLSFDFRLFKCDCKLPSEFIVSYTIKISQAKSVEVYLSLVLGGKPNYILLSPFEKGNFLHFFKKIIH